MIEGLKRFYANVALDQDKQNSINLFLGIDGPDSGISTAVKVVANASNLVNAVGNAIGNKASPVSAATMGENVFPGKAGNFANDTESLAPSTYTDAEKSKEHSQHEEVQEESYPENVADRNRRDYRFWYTRKHLNKHMDAEELSLRTQEIAKEDGNYWLE